MCTSQTAERQPRIYFVYSVMIGSRVGGNRIKNEPDWFSVHVAEPAGCEKTACVCVVCGTNVMDECEGIWASHYYWIFLTMHYARHLVSKLAFTT